MSLPPIHIAAARRLRRKFLEAEKQYQNLCHIVVRHSDPNRVLWDDDGTMSRVLNATAGFALVLGCDPATGAQRFPFFAHDINMDGKPLRHQGIFYDATGIDCDKDYGDWANARLAGVYSKQAGAPEMMPSQSARDGTQTARALEHFTRLAVEACQHELAEPAPFIPGRIDGIARRDGWLAHVYCTLNPAAVRRGEIEALPLPGNVFSASVLALDLMFSRSPLADQAVVTSAAVTGSRGETPALSDTETSAPENALLALRHKLEGFIEDWRSIRHEFDPDKPGDEVRASEAVRDDIERLWMQRFAPLALRIVKTIGRDRFPERFSNPKTPVVVTDPGKMPEELTGTENVTDAGMRILLWAAGSVDPEFMDRTNPSFSDMMRRWAQTALLCDHQPADQWFCRTVNQPMDWVLRALDVLTQITQPAAGRHRPMVNDDAAKRGGLLIAEPAPNGGKVASSQLSTDRRAGQTKQIGTTIAKRQAQHEWLAKAMLLVQEHPDWSDAKIAQKVGKHKSSLSRSRAYQAAAVLARGSKTDLREGHITVDSETGLFDVEAVTTDTKADRGQPIAGSKYFREYCVECGEPMKVLPEKVGKKPVCEDCQT